MMGEKNMVRVSPQAAFGEIMDTYAQQKGLHAHDMRFVLHGDCLNRGNACAELELEAGDTVYVHERLSITLEDLIGEEKTYRVSPLGAFRKVVDTYAQQKGLHAGD
jgi:hypothetical protein